MNTLRAADAGPLVEGCVAGDPVEVEDIDPEQLAAFWKAVASKLAERREHFRAHYKEAAWNPDTPHGPSTSQP